METDYSDFRKNDRNSRRISPKIITLKRLLFFWTSIINRDFRMHRNGIENIFCSFIRWSETSMRSKIPSSLSNMKIDSIFSDICTDMTCIGKISSIISRLVSVFSINWKYATRGKSPGSVRVNFSGWYKKLLHRFSILEMCHIKLSIILLINTQSIRFIQNRVTTSADIVYMNGTFCLSHSRERERDRHTG